MTKTNAMRLLDKAKISYQCVQYAYDENDLSGIHAAAEIGMPPEQVFKTLVTRNEKNEFQVYCIPVCCELDLKKAAKAVQHKKVELIAVKELQPLTGYIRGGCSPIGMKKLFPTFMDFSALNYDIIGISAGKRGCQLLLNPNDLSHYVPITFSDLTVK